MGFFKRLKFIFGLLVVLAVVGIFFLYLNYTMLNISSQRATLETDSYMVSSEYDGVLRRQFVDIGDKVEEGDRLFEIDSPSLTQALRDERVEIDSLLFEVSDEGNMILLANAPGTTQQINFADGSYLEANSNIATIATVNARYVVAYYLLNAPDYARINRDNPVHVTLPDNSKYEANVFDINLEREGEQIFTVVRARLPKDADILPTFSSVTPVTTSWDLNSSDWQDTIFEFVRTLIEPQTQEL